MEYDEYLDKVHTRDRELFIRLLAGLREIPTLDEAQRFFEFVSQNYEFAKLVVGNLDPGERYLDASQVKMLHDQLLIRRAHER